MTRLLSERIMLKIGGRRVPFRSYHILAELPQFLFRGGESLEDVGRRADEIVDTVVKPWLVYAQVAEEDPHILIVSHGIVSL